MGSIVLPQLEICMTCRGEAQRCRRTEDTHDSWKVTNYGVHMG